MVLGGLFGLTLTLTTVTDGEILQNPRYFSVGGIVTSLNLTHSYDCYVHGLYLCPVTASSVAREPGDSPNFPSLFLILDFDISVNLAADDLALENVESESLCIS
mmetsp:Transcript_616/g.964  ORF Transcript_616/g.964 Transcript_616/m.964 type:complete len:104 (+) Transcript_616:61-372(+)|eukprot:scaffold6624_cov160-Skeletonema_menzelii.AAC.4